MSIRVALCDDSRELCQAYQNLFEQYADIDFVGTAYDSKACLQLVQNRKPDVLLLDICLEQQEAGLSIISQLLEMQPDLKIIMLTGFRNEDYVFKAFADGAVDYIVKSLAVDEVIQSIRNVYQDKQVLSNDVTKMLVSKTKQVSEGQKSVLYLVNKLLQLSPTEFEVLRMLYYGSQYKEIAKIKVVEESTVRTLGSRILKKFEHTSMKELLVYLRQIGIFEFIDNRGEL